MLRLERVCSYYGNIQALRQISFDLGEGEVVALIGANGAGKTTTLRTISGLIRASRGRVLLDEWRIDGWTVERIVGAGIVHVPEGRQIFPGLTVLENLEVAASAWQKRNTNLAPDLRRVFELFPVLERRKHQLGWSLSGGEQQMLTIGRGLMARPRVLMLDEPSLGLAPILTREVFATIERIRRQGMAILLVEQNAHEALKLADRGCVLQNGEIVIQGSAAELLASHAVQAAYMGE